MEINVNVKISLSEDTVAILTGLLGSGAITTVKETAPVVKLDKTDKAEKSDKTTKADKKTSDAGSGAAATNTGATGTEDLRLKIREKVVALRDGGKKDDTVKLMQEYSITQLSKLPEDKLTEFLEKLNAVK